MNLKITFISLVNLTEPNGCEIFHKVDEEKVNDQKSTP